ncbi:unnamed protein product [Phytophthora fragariaefolia]|uniref:Unnamed protein product n=1 Tax=Phytophthora fragariaefolia TaxID=1490495 RepID=A0A9W6Y5J2_9STRA|nr:unnamed protein product [Phytophthora fragariaefolia]
MVGGTGKQPQHKLTEQELLLCREALLSDRHARRVRRQVNKSRQTGAEEKRPKKGTRKEGAKRTTVVMETRGPLEDAEPKTVGVIGVYEEEAKESAASVEDEAEEKVSDVVADSPQVDDAEEKESDVGEDSALLSDAEEEKEREVGGDVGQSSKMSGSDEKDSDENLAVPDLARLSPKCVIDGDANPMDAAADICTCLNSDEDMLVEEDQESCGDDVDDDSDWYIGELTDEDSEDDGGDALPDSVCSSLAQSKQAMSMMRTNGWEYDPDKFGPDPTYEDLYDGPYGPSDSVMTVGDDPLALLFYFMPPKLWTQISFESNRYHTQSIPQRARTIRSQQRRAGQEVKELGDIRSRLAGVPDIEPWEVLRVMGLLIARMLMPMRKGIAAHWSTKQTPVPKDINTGKAAVLRNINALCPPSTTSPWRLVITDRFYTSVKLALELLHRRMYLTGTIQADRAGYAKGVITKKEIKVNKQKIVIPPQGTIKLAANKRFLQLTATMWMDRTPVYLLSRGAVVSAETYQTIEVRYQNYIIIQESNVVSAILTCHFNQSATTARERTVGIREYGRHGRASPRRKPRYGGQRARPQQVPAFLQSVRTVQDQTEEVHEVLLS